MNQQNFFPRNAKAYKSDLIPTVGVEHPIGLVKPHPKDWVNYQLCQYDAFSVVMYDGYFDAADDVSYTRQREYVKVNFWLSGRHSTVLDGFGEHEHDRPDVSITSCPPDALKVDLIKRESQFAVVALCLLPEFFPTYMGLATDQLPDPLRSAFLPGNRQYAFCTSPLTADLASAAGAALAAPPSVRSTPCYAQAKSVELMCLLINLMATRQDSLSNSGRSLARHSARLQQARDLINRRFAENLTICDIAREVGLNQLALTAGFRRLFQVSVFEHLRKVRMERAYVMLTTSQCSITQAAEAVGYSHACNFSTAFTRHFGCSPQALRRRQ